MTTETTTPAARALARQVLTTAAQGQLTLINGTALRPHGGWAALGIALGIEFEANRDTDLLTCEMGLGSNPSPHPLTAAMRGDGICSFIDWDTDLDIPRSDADWDANPDIYDRLPYELNGFGKPSITAVARYFFDDPPTDGQNPILLIDVAYARPYSEILRRQNLMPDPATRLAATSETYKWLARDLATLASIRPTEPTIIASDDQAPEWAALTEHAALTLPRPHLASV